MYISFQCSLLASLIRNSWLWPWKRHRSLKCMYTFHLFCLGQHDYCLYIMITPIKKVNHPISCCKCVCVADSGHTIFFVCLFLQIWTYTSDTSADDIIKAPGWSSLTGGAQSLVPARGQDPRLCETTIEPTNNYWFGDWVVKIAPLVRAGL